VNAHGDGTRHGDRLEAQAIRATLGDVPVTAPKSYFGFLGAGTGMVELVASLVALEAGRIPPTLNYRMADPDCPLRVVHGEPWEAQAPSALKLNYSPTGQAVAVLLDAPWRS
jgi:3-oxoacyl-[acyl-carrier-protein] synthase II